MTRPKHQPCPCGCGELADECMNPNRSAALGAFTVEEPIGTRPDWFANNHETRFGGRPHNLHRLAETEPGRHEWACRCDVGGHESTPAEAVDAYNRHAAQAAPGATRPSRSPR